MIRDLKALALTLIYNFKHNHGWLFALIGYLAGAIMMLKVLKEMNLL